MLPKCSGQTTAGGDTGRSHVGHVLLPEMGNKGNSHMLMQDTNSLELAD
jgi:hypothetical protein